jgi:hypothetical protein
MSTDRDVTRIVRSWLEEGRTALPDHVLDTVLDQLPATPQRRASWLARRLPDMNTPARIAAAVAAVIAIVVIGALVIPRGGGVAQPAATVGASGGPGPSAAPTVFTSSRYRYSITLPAGWFAGSALQTWDGKGAPTIIDNTVDTFGSSALAAAAPTKSSLSEWVATSIAAVQQDHSDTCPTSPDSVTPVTIGGQPGTLVAWNCGILINNALTVVNGYGYLFTFRDPAVAAATDPADQALFTTMLRSVVFH